MGCDVEVDEVGKRRRFLTRTLEKIHSNGGRRQQEREAVPTYIPEDRIGC
jgi:hypothetical protein